MKAVTPTPDGTTLPSSPDAAAPSAKSASDPSTSPTSRPSDRTLFRVAVLISVSPILISAVRNGLLGWYPSADAGITAVRTVDVFSAHPPLYGLPAFPSTQTGVAFGYLGAPINYLLAIPVKLLGVSWGILVGMGVLNSAWLITALWLVRRRVGYRTAILACAFTTSLLWGVGSQALVDPTPVRCGLIAALTLFAAAWSVAEGDAKALVPLALAANFLVLDHLKFIVVAPLMVVLSLVLWMVRLRGRPVTASEDGPTEPTHTRRWVVASLVVTVIMWAPTLGQQLFSPNGNIGNLVRGLARGPGASGQSAIHHGLLDAIGVVSSPIVTRPLWFRPSLEHPHFWVYGPKSPFLDEAIGIAVVLGLTVLFAANARRRRDSTTFVALTVGAAAWGAWIISGVLLSRSSGWVLRYLQALWPVSMFIWFTFALALVRSGWLRGPVRRLRLQGAGVPLAIAVSTVFAVLSIPIANFGAATSQEAIPVALQIRRDVKRRVPAGSPVLITSSPEAWPYVSAVTGALQEAGIDFRFTSSWAIETYGSQRAFKSQPGHRVPELLVTTSTQSADTWSLLSWGGPSLNESHEQFLAVGDQMNTWARAARGLRIPPSAPDTPATRKFIRALIADQLATARAEHKSPLALKTFVHLLVDGQHRYLLDSIDVPGLTRSEKLMWLEDQYALLNNQVAMVYLRRS